MMLVLIFTGLFVHVRQKEIWGYNLAEISNLHAECGFSWILVFLKSSTLQTALIVKQILKIIIKKCTLCYE